MNSKEQIKAVIDYEKPDRTSNIVLNYLNELPNFLALFMYSFFVVAISNILIEISGELNINPESLNLVITFYFGGAMIGQIIYFFVVNKYSEKVLFIASICLAILTILLMSFSNKLWHLYLLYLITGVSFGLLLVIANASLIEGKIKNKNSAVSLGHSFFAIGAISSPFITSIIVGNSLDWRIIYYIMAAFLVLLIILKLIQKEENKVTGGLKDNPIKILKVFNNKSKNIFIIITALILFLYTYSETVFFSWIPTFLRLEKSLDLFYAGLIISIFYGGVLIGRLIISLITYKIRTNLILVIIAVVSLVSVSAIIYSQSIIIIFLSTFFGGIGFSGIFPLLSSTGCIVYKYGRGIIMNFLLMVAVFANTITPFFIKLISRYSLTISVNIMILFFGLIVILILIRWYFDRKHGCSL
jgi:MFS transporter, FHS family, glucose/mannose:H+ symporter